MSRNAFRSNALKQLALSAAIASDDSASAFDGFLQYCPRAQKAQSPAKSSPITLKPEEIDTLLALCHVAPFINSEQKATAILAILTPYLVDSGAVQLHHSANSHGLQPSLWETLTFQMTKACLVLGLRQSGLCETILECFTHYLQCCISSLDKLSDAPAADAEGKDAASQTGIALQLSMLGFLEAAASHTHALKDAELLKLLRYVLKILEEGTLDRFERAVDGIAETTKPENDVNTFHAVVLFYASTGRPLVRSLLQNALLDLLVSASSLQIATPKQLATANTFGIFSRQGNNPQVNGYHQSSSSLNSLMSRVSAQIIEASIDKHGLRMGILAGQDRLLYSLKAKGLHVYLNCWMANDHPDNEQLLNWLQDTLTDPVSMGNEDLAAVVLHSLAICARSSSSLVAELSRSLPRLIVQSGIRGATVDTASRSLCQILSLVSQDAVITGIYTLGNVLKTGGEKVSHNSALPNGLVESLNLFQHHQTATLHPTGSVISMNASGDEEISAAYGNVIRAIVGIAITCSNLKVAALAQSMLLQKLGRVTFAVDLHIVREAANLALIGGYEEFASLLKFYDRVVHEGVKRDDEIILKAVRTARLKIAKAVRPETPHYRQYVSSLLESLISKGENYENRGFANDSHDLAAREIAELIAPLNKLLAVDTESASVSDDELIARLHREAWFNIVIHNVTPWSYHGKRWATELRGLALRSDALISESRGDQYESELELNAVLRRGMNGPNTAEQKKRLIHLLPMCDAEIRSLSYPKVIFLLSMLLIEILRAEAGDCSHILTYFLDPSLSGKAMQNCTSAVAEKVMTTYIKHAKGGANERGTTSLAAQQLISMFMGCCHRIPRVQQIAAASADQIVRHLPSSLCQRSSLFALLELLSLLWTSCLEAELDEYELKARYSSSRGLVHVELSDDYDYRKTTLNNLYKRAKSWVTYVIDIAPLNVKGLLQTYLSDYTDDGTYGHLALGRSFAMDMGSVISAASLKLVVTDRHGECNINTASDFIAQYTSRQEYKHADNVPSPNAEDGDCIKSNGILPNFNRQIQNKDFRREEYLDSLEKRAQDGRFIPTPELRDSLQRAAAYLSRSTGNSPRLLQRLVDVPFLIFTKQSIRLGISIWLNIINERPDTEAMIVALVADNWEKSVRNREGAFSPKLWQKDPFFLKEEFAPTDKSAVLGWQQAAHDCIAPHLSLLQFLMSHYNANRSNVSPLQDTFLRFVQLTLWELRDCSGHPLAREFHLQVVSFGLILLEHFTQMSREAEWQLKDATLSAGLAWFRHAPRWSFGGNRLQIKAEMRLITELESSFGRLGGRFARNLEPLPSLSLKLQLLTLLLESEKSRLSVWLSPLEHDRRRVSALRPTHRDLTGPNLMNLIQVAWNEDAKLAVHLPTRFTSPQIYNEIRALLLRFPERVIKEPDALNLLIGASLASDVSFQLRYLLYWAPVNPVTAMTYFLPEYRNDPFMIQYAMRTLESYPVNVTFFYVPQLVQTLRYDVLGYVQRYILETAQVSQLFAHQIIWNMKANAYKDEESSIEDSLKPTLDIVRDRMIKSFSQADREFYEREFAFFGEVTDISGKLRPYIKKSKPEKKQKIEDELRKIKVDVGVYLPSNPDGTVIGIDRKSGKPLQSHAKAPYMATFRIKKVQGDVGAVEDIIKHDDVGTNGNVREADESSEIWQSAIFKVGDDCRQDILALQMIAAFRGIFNSVGLDVYVFPNRVTATAPGCGVIDVLPNSISRDMLGREAINGLFEYFVSKYGAESSIAFQEARNNFVKSMAPYSVISYLLQFKDRHNGNIMIDSSGHILHIDFGFCFDIAPGGVRFERAPFKLTSEMIAVMGGTTTSQAFQWFEELCVKSFLASRPYAEKLCDIVVLMLGSGLPCFKPESITHLRERFVLERSEREAADFMRDLIKKSYSSYSTKGYDQFQLLTNGIPY